MKNFLTAAAFSLVFSGLNAQDLKESAVPVPVREAFNKEYPGVKAEWEKEDGHYEAEFKISGKETSIVYNEKGESLRTEAEIDPADLPAGVKEYVAKQLPGKKITEAERITDPTGAVRFEAEIDDTDYLFDDQGALLSKEKDDQDKEDDDK